ncbi:hypothetical protein SAMN05421505_110184 [Sinosporangium album]|uniref:Ketoreductase domain-containing protein n=1 Tax=Sinosporangium album TaxID=504805 RepID=A0A1G7Z4A4_9ACTN|nr:SDR family oxidoreductase [Sinosporangium album]SDH03419.1 hypothetical protein SAMN05421505_110184 [Sinosporangium album]
MQQRIRTALVTGASSGIGEAFARELARRNCGLVLVARRAERLQTLAGELRERHGVDAEVLAADLLDRDRLGAVEERLSDPDRPIDLLVNNAGALTSGFFSALPLDEELSEIELNSVVPLRLTHKALPGMLERGHGAILNVSSIAGEAPAPYSATYSSTYAFLTVFGQSLHAEVKRHGVTVTTLLPGFTSGPGEVPVGGAAASGDGPNGQTGQTGQTGETGETGETANGEYGTAIRVQRADRVVRDALRALAAGHPLCIPGIRNKSSAAFARLAPRRALLSLMETVRAPAESG